MSDTAPTLAATIRATVDSRLGDHWVAVPARVESYDPVRYRVSAQPLVRRAYTDEEGERQTERLPVVPEVPVMMPGSGGVRFKFPIRSGDEGVLLFTSCSLDRWLSVGGEVDPADDRRGALSDAVFLPGFTGGPAGPGDATPQVEITETAILLGGALATDGIIRGTARDAAEQTFLSALSTFVTAIVDPAAVPTAAKTAMTAAINAFKLAATASVSAVTRTV